MKVLLYLLTFILGALGALSLLRSVERLITGSGIMPAQILIGLVFLVLAWKCLAKARSGPAA